MGGISTRSTGDRSQARWILSMMTSPRRFCRASLGSGQCREIGRVFEVEAGCWEVRQAVGVQACQRRLAALAQSEQRDDWLDLEPNGNLRQVMVSLHTRIFGIHCRIFEYVSPVSPHAAKPRDAVIPAPVQSSVPTPSAMPS